MGREIDTEVVIVGGGAGGSALATLLARRGAVVIEREGRFRDRVRGEAIHPWGYRQAVEAGLAPVLEAAGAHALPIWQPYVDREPAEPSRWNDDPENDFPELSVGHPALQSASLAAAEAAGAIVLRPAAARGVERSGDGWRVAIETGDGERLTVTGRLLIGADGRESAVRRWLGVTAIVDPEHHRFGGLLIDGCRLDEERVHAVSFEGGIAYLMPQGGGTARIYAGGGRAVVAPLAADRSGGALINLLARHLPAGVLEGVTAAGPVAFFPNGDVVPRQVAGPDWALIGDAAGANDPSVGQGLSLMYRDVRRLNELLVRHDDRQEALDAYGAERRAHHAVTREHARWIGSLNMESGDLVEARRAGVRRAKEADPTQGGFAFIYTRGPMGLVADEAARRRFFGEE